MAKKLICPHCNQEVDPGVMECPYCHESMFLNLNQIKAKEQENYEKNHVVTQEEYIAQQQQLQYQQQLNPNYNQPVQQPMQQPTNKMNPRKVISTFLIILLIAIPAVWCYLNKERLLVKTNKKIVTVTKDCKYDGSLEINDEDLNHIKYPTFTEGAFQYTYVDYDENSGGWYMTLDPEYDDAKIESEMCTTVNGKPVNAMMHIVNKKADYIDLSKINTGLVEDFLSTFSTARIDYLNLTSFDTSHAKSYSYMFSNTRIKTLNISNFKSDGVDFECMFNGAKIDTLMLGNMKIEEPERSIFKIFEDAKIKKVYATNQTTIDLIKEELGDDVEIITKEK